MTLIGLIGELSKWPAFIIYVCSSAVCAKEETVSKTLGRVRLIN